ncbi:tetratricopeptide repeat protein [Hymenobacter sp. BRD67]|uniref:tetratricopeptide repeat protein n=1 Tax=Hymenobacter sp. BRD67 TaxID=2675877 RepID=UPI001563B7FA|nr:tetratricopeptide repeat protein [Hymenobacter sp. BRD67]QKG51394.1 tetratricopeptide repeat protein [Hymenobacter sp. BRD67]
MQAFFRKSFFIIMGLLGLLPQHSHGQMGMNTHLQRDSLRALLNAQPIDTNRVLRLIQLGQLYEGSQPDSAKALYQRAGRLSERLHYPLGVVKYIANYTSVLNIEGRFAESAQLNQRAVALSRRYHLRRYLAVSLGNLSNVYLRQENYPLAIATMLQARPLLEALHDQSSLSLLYNSLSVCYDNLHQNAEALRCGQQALALGETMHDDYLVTLACIQLGNTYKATGRLRESLATYQRGYALARKLRVVEAQKSIIFNLGDLYVQLENPAKARPLYQQAVQLADSIHDVEGQAEARKGMALSYYLAQQYGPAEQYARQGLDLAGRHGIKKVQRDCYDVLADIAIAQGRLVAGQRLRHQADALGRRCSAQPCRKALRKWKPATVCSSSALRWPSSGASCCCASTRWPSSAAGCWPPGWA